MAIKLRLTKRDKWVILGILLVAIVCSCLIIFLSKSENLVAHVFLKNEDVTQIYLFQEYGERDILFKGDVTNMMFTVKKNAIKVKESGCETQECVHTGYINSTSQTIVCVYNKVVITLEVYK